MEVFFLLKFTFLKILYSEYWGEDGYIRLARGKNMCGGYYFYFLIKKILIKNLKLLMILFILLLHDQNKSFH